MFEDWSIPHYILDFSLQRSETEPEYPVVGLSIMAAKTQQMF